jgi:2-polyprenyl-3-methyl-5-hydroxy-6-metoxy-1,4-benzoquinol methylase
MKADFVSHAMKGTISYDAEFFASQKGLSYRSAQQVIPIIQSFIPINSVCDVGCGVGTWLRAFREAGVQDVFGIDGNYVDKRFLEISETAFYEADLRQPLGLNRTFDLAISLEVAEHLPESRSAGLVGDLTRLAPAVLFSAAIPRQGGTDHINEQWQSYWAAIFEQHNFVTCDVLRPLIWNNANIARWYRQNMLLFCRSDFLPKAPRLTPRQEGGLPLSVVHPQQYVEIWDEVNVPRSWQLLSRALQRAVQRRVERLVFGALTAKEASGVINAARAEPLLTHDFSSIPNSDVSGVSGRQTPDAKR